MVIDQLTARGVMNAGALYDAPFKGLHAGGPDALFAGQDNWGQQPAHRQHRQHGLDVCPHRRCRRDVLCPRAGGHECRHERGVERGAVYSLAAGTAVWGHTPASRAGQARVVRCEAHRGRPRSVLNSSFLRRTVSRSCGSSAKEPPAGARCPTRGRW